MKELAEKLLKQLDAVRGTIEFEPTLFESLKELAQKCGTQLQYPRSYATGEVSIIVNGEYGEVFSNLLRGLRCRTGQIQYGYKAIMLPSNNWCYMPFSELEKIIKKAAEA